MIWLTKLAQVLPTALELFRLVRAAILAARKIKPNPNRSTLNSLVDESTQSGDQRELEKAISGVGGEPTKHNIDGLVRKPPREDNRD